MENKEKLAFMSKMDRRNFFRKSEKLAILALIGMAKTNPVFSLLPAAGAEATLADSNRRLMIPSVWWRALSKTETGKLSYWDTAKLKSLKANWVSASYRPLDAENNFMGVSWVIPPGMIERVMELAKPGLESAHKAGIEVVGTTDSMQFNPTIMKSVGIDPEILYGRSLSGAPIGFDAYQKDNFLSCLLNPHWQEIETTIGREHAKAGFDGLFLDLFPYVIREGVFCHCQYCKKEWSAYSEKTFGKKQEIPAAPLHLDKTIDRTFMAWRIENLHHFMEKIQGAGRKFNPAFKVILNCNSDNPCMAYLLLMGMPQPTSELGQLSAGDESSIYLYRMIDSASKDPLFSQFNGAKQYMPVYKYKTALAEGFAAGGALMLAAKNKAMDSINKRFTDFLIKNRDAFEGSKSEANAAILFSWRDHSFVQSPPIIRTDRMHWFRNSARRTAAALASKAIPFDYLFVEKGITTNDLLKYKVIIAPELKLLDEKDAAVIKDYVEKGGKLLALGDFGTLKSNGLDYSNREVGLIRSWTSAEPGNEYHEAALGKGKICTAGTYITGKTEAEMAVTPALNKAIASLNLDSQLKVKHNGNGRIESTIFKNGRKQFLHLIRYACKGAAGETDVTVQYSIPANKKINTVTAQSPYTGKDKEALKWKAVGDQLTITTSIDLYTMVTVEFKQ
jgi:hypothetical protein